MTVVIEDHVLGDEGCRIFARSWMPSSGSSDLPPVLLFHDSLGCVELWRTFPERLAETTGRRVIAYDRLGFGRSDPHPGTLDFDFISAEPGQSIALLQKAARFDTFVACGHSVGGGMAVEAAAKCPEACEALLTIGAQAFVESLTLEGIRKARESFASEQSLSRLSRYHGVKSRWIVDAWTETWLDRRFHDWSLDDALARVRCPVLAIHGERDEYGSAEHPQRIARGRGKSVILERVGHVPHREAEDVVVKLIGSFLTGSDVRRTASPYA